MPLLLMAKTGDLPPTRLAFAWYWHIAIGFPFADDAMWQYY